jgi:hypothetical protein
MLLPPNPHLAELPPSSVHGRQDRSCSGPQFQCLYPEDLYVKLRTHLGNLPPQLKKIFTFLLSYPTKVTLGSRGITDPLHI